MKKIIPTNLDTFINDNYHWSSLEKSLTELIDNSINSRTEEWVIIDIVITDDVVRISDNWNWMDLEWLKKALTLWHSEKQSRKIKSWLVMACLLLWKKYEIVTKKQWDEYEYSVVFDAEELVTKNGFDFVYNTKKVRNDEHYTYTLVHDLRTKDPLKKINKLVHNLEVKFSPYIENENDNIEISINNTKLESVEVKIIPELMLWIDTETSYWKINWWVSYAINWKSDYWIHCYKNKKLIRPFNKIWFKPHPSLHRLYWKINMDFVPLNQDKTDFIIDSPEYIFVEKYMSHKLKYLIDECAIIYD